MATGSGGGPVAGSENDGFAEAGPHDVRDRLSARLLFDEDEFAAGEVAIGFAQEEDGLEGEDDLAVEVLVEAIEIAGSVLEQKRGGASLSGGVAALGERRKGRGEAFGGAELGHPIIGDRGEPRIEMFAETGDERGERIGEILILAAPEAVALHVDPAPEMSGLGVEGPEGGAVGFVEERRQKGVSALRESGFDLGPVEIREALVDRHIPKLRGKARREPSGTCGGIHKKNSRREQNKGGGRTSI